MSQARDGALPGARQRFAQRFALLYTSAGNLPLRRAADAANERMRAARGAGGSVTTAQRISDWRGGRNVPARFESLLPVLMMLIERARKTHPEPPAPGLYDMHGWQRLWSDALASSSTAPPAPVEVPDSTSPYLGLESYRQDDAGLFFGRRRAVDALVRRVGSAARSGGMVIVVGASGAGKSSLLQAGLIPALVRGDLPVDGSAAWPVVLMSPGARPLAALSAQIPGISRAGAPEATVGESVAELTADTGVHQVAVIVDQFEEVFTLCRSAVERRRFLATLRSICTATTPDGPPPGVVVIGVRADFYARCLDHPELAEALQDRGLVLGAMRPNELREAITGPAKAAGLKLESGLEEVLVHDLRGMGRSEAGTDSTADSAAHGGADDTPVGPDAYEPGALPLLSHVLQATWQRRQKGKLTIIGYREAGGVRGSVAATAEQAWDTLDPAAREAGRHLLLRLVRIGDDTRDTRRNATRSDLIGAAANPASTEAALEALAGARLLTLDADSVELTHEVVIDAWPRLRAWIDEDRAGNLVRQRLVADAQEWNRHGRDPAGLYRGTRLDAALERTADGQLDHNATAIDLLAESVRHRRRGNRTRRMLVGAVVVLAIVALVGAVLATVQSSTANRQRDDAVFRQVIAEADRLRTGDPSLSAQLDLVAHGLRPADNGVYTRLLSTQNVPLSTPLTGHKGAVYVVAYSPNGQLLASASYDGTIRLWNVSDPGHPSPLGEPIRASGTWLTSVAFSPDGSVLAGADGDGAVQLWNIVDPLHPVKLGDPLTGSHGAVYVVAFSPDGRTLAAPSDDHTIQLWNVSDPAHATRLGPPLTGPTAAIRTVAFSPDGHLLAAGSDDTLVRLWDVSDAARPVPIGAPLGGFRGIAHSVAFSPNSKILAAGSDDSTARLWDVSDPADPVAIGQALKAHTAAIWSVAFSPDGNTLATGSWDGTARLWDISEPRRPVLLGQPLAGSSGGIVSVAFSPSGRSLATGGQDAVVRLWNLPPAVIGGHTARITPPSFSADGKLMATGSYDESIRLWSLADPTRPVTVARWIPDKQGASQAGWQVALSGDGHLLAAANSNGGHVQLWDTTDPARPVPAGPPLDLQTRYTDQLAFSPDGRVLATGSDDRTIQLWNVADPHHPTPLGTPLTGATAWVNAFAFSPDGRTVAGASSDGKVYLWNVSAAVGGAPIAELTGHTGPVDAVVFAPDGRTLASAGDDQTIRLWDVQDPRHPRALSGPIEGHTSTIRSLSFAPDGKTLASGADDQTVRLWDVADPRHPAPIGDSFADHGVVRWQVDFDPAGHFLAATGEGGVLRLWSLDENDAVNRICADTRGILTPEVWREHLPDLLRYDPPCG